MQKDGTIDTRATLGTLFVSLSHCNPSFLPPDSIVLCFFFFAVHSLTSGRFNIVGILRLVFVVHSLTHS